MKEVTTKHGHKWMCPETVGEFQTAGVNIDEVCRWACLYLNGLMATRSIVANKDGTPFSASITGMRRGKLDPLEKGKARALKIASKLTHEARAALLAELQKEAP